MEIEFRDGDGEATGPQLRGKVRWMEVPGWLKTAVANSPDPVNQIIFEGERFDVMSVRRWRDLFLDLGRFPMPSKISNYPGN